MFAPAWKPFHYPIFTTIWLATVASNTGGWMYSAASAWLMTSLHPGAVMVSLVQAAATLPIFLFAIPAGALADSMDKRRFLLSGEIGITITAALFAAIVWYGFATPSKVLLFTFISSAAVAVTSPAWQVVVPQLVPKADLRAAVTATIVGMNLSRAIGPALSGLMIAGFGIAAPFWMNAFSNLGVIVALLAWQPQYLGKATLRIRRLPIVIRIGLRHSYRNSRLRAALVRTAAFFPFASAYWALLPLLVSEQVSGGADLYGYALGVIGASAVVCAIFLPSLQDRLGCDAMARLASCATAVALIMFGLAESWPLTMAASIVAGASWIAAVASLNVAAQVALPDWVRGRGLALYVTFLYGALSVGSAAWGTLAHLTGLSNAHLLAAAALLLSTYATAGWKLQPSRASLA